MVELFKAFVDIALWRKGPQHLPTSALLLVIIVALDGVLTLTFTGAFEPQEPALRIPLEVGLSLGWIWLLLAVFGRAERFVQTATAVFGTSVLLTPLMFGMRTMLEAVGKTSMLLVPLRLGLLTVFVWYLLINANIVRAALEVNLFVAVLLTLLGTGCVYIIATRVLALATQVA
ncbi:MAG TPA: hypothetical protein VJ764_03590 [Steroidobacteraceae bacterium]|nr:hypothetical protein [Steroidobacteraceae bacterium]